MSRLRAGETVLPCGCRHTDQTWVPSREHPDLGMCEAHKAEWRERHLAAAAAHTAASKEKDGE
jgi:hypothetical protein